MYTYIYQFLFLSIFVLLLWMGGFTEFQPFLFNKCNLDFYKPSIHFQSLKTVDSALFAIFFIDFMENGIFEGFYSTIFASNLAFTYFFFCPISISIYNYNNFRLLHIPLYISEALFIFFKYSLCLWFRLNSFFCHVFRFNCFFSVLSIIKSRQ